MGKTQSKLFIGMAWQGNGMGTATCELGFTPLTALLVSTTDEPISLISRKHLPVIGIMSYFS
jgi:hypothetical protein